MMESYTDEQGNKCDGKEISVRKAEAYSETSQTSKIECFLVTVFSC